MLAPFDFRPPPTANEIRAALERVCISQPFGHAPKLPRFLRFVVEATLAGQGGGLKGYTIGVEALGRDDSFNPQADPIVRMEAIGLRGALGRQYAGGGRGDPLLIELPRGGYVPRFHWHGPVAGGHRLLRMIHKLQRLLQMRVILRMPSDPH